MSTSYVRPNNLRPIRLLIGSLVFLIITGGAGLGATKTWTGGGADNNVSTAANWGGTTPVANDDVQFAGSVRVIPNLDVSLAINSLSFNSGAAAFTIGGNNLATVSSGGVTNNSTNTQTINNPIALAAAQTWSATSGNLVFGGNVANGGFLLPALAVWPVVSARRSLAA